MVTATYPAFLNLFSRYPLNLKSFVNNNNKKKLITMVITVEGTLHKLPNCNSVSTINYLPFQTQLHCTSFSAAPTPIPINAAFFRGVHTYVLNNVISFVS